jgi:Ni,Fe-hydrogenase maturation factor
MAESKRDKTLVIGMGNLLMQDEGIGVRALENRLGLTPEAAEGLEEMVQMLVDELASLGIQLEPRSRAGDGRWKQEASPEASSELSG